MSNKLFAEDFFKAWEAGQTDFILTTSGSTGTPKPIRLERKFLEWSAGNTQKHLSLSSEEYIFCCIPVQKTGGFMMLVRSAVLHYPITVSEPAADPLADIPEAHPYTFISLVPLQLQAIFNHPASIARLNRFKHLLVGGSDISDDLVSLLQTLKTEAWHTYGMTETYSHIALRKLNGTNAEHTFHPLSDITISTDDRGCLCIMAPFTNGTWLPTNDCADILPDGSFRITGRSDFIINSGGIKLQPERIEHYIRLSMPETANRRLVVTSVDDAILGEKAILVIEGPETILSDESWNRLAREAPPYHIPKDVFFMPDIPFTETGKPDRIKVKELVSLQLKS